MDKFEFSESDNKILEILAQFENELKEKINNPMKQIDTTKYYDKFQISKITYPLKDIYITEIIENGKKSVHMFWGNALKEILTIDENGNVIIDDTIKPFLKGVDISSILEDNNVINKNNLRGISKKLKYEDEKNIDLNEYKTENKVTGDKSNGDKIDEDRVDKNRTDEDTIDISNSKKLNNDLKKQFKQDLQISYYRKIEDEQLQKEIPSVKGKDEVGMAYSKTLNAYIFCVKEGNQYKKVDEIYPAQMTMKSVISIDEKGEKVEKKVPHALMKTNDSTKEISVTIGQYGYIETGIIHRLPCNKRLEYQVKEQGEGEQGKSTKEIRDIFNKSGKMNIDNIAHRFNEDENNGIEEQEIENIDNDDILILSDGTRTTFQKEAEKDKISVQEFKNIYEKAKGETVDEKLDETHEEINKDFGAPTIEHNR